MDVERTMPFILDALARREAATGQSEVMARRHEERPTRVENGLATAADLAGRLAQAESGSAAQFWTLPLVAAAGLRRPATDARWRSGRLPVAAIRLVERLDRRAAEGKARRDELMESRARTDRRLDAWIEIVDKMTRRDRS